MSETPKIEIHEKQTRGHETRDANVRAVTMFGIGLFIVTAIVMVFIFWLQDFFTMQKASSEPPLSPLASQRQSLPPEPRLQVTPEKDLRKLHAEEDSVLNSYGWIIREAGVVRIPIDSAIDLVAERGLPVRTDRELKIENGGSRP
jgi:hypothetical protein